MYNIEALKKEVVERLSTLDPQQIIIFGSYAHGTPSEDSDVDVYVVTKEQSIPQNYQEKRELVRRVSRLLIDIRQRVGMDLLVHTAAMHKKFYSLNSSLAREIQEKGIRLL